MHVEKVLSAFSYLPSSWNASIFPEKNNSRNQQSRIGISKTQIKIGAYDCFPAYSQKNSRLTHKNWDNDSHMIKS